MFSLELKLRHWARFRWAACQLDVLAKCSSLQKLRKALHSLPTTLEETYDRIFLNISEESRDDAVKLLQWLAFSSRPLALVEMAEVFAIDPDEPRFNPDQRPREPRTILDICSSLITVSHCAVHEEDYGSPLRGLPASVVESGILSLAHLSVKEYVISQRVKDSYYHLDKKLADSAISRDCLAYLFQFDTVDCLCDQSEAAISFGRYAAKYWITHARSDDGIIQNDVQQLVERLLCSSSVHFNNWVTLFDADQGYGSDSLESSYGVPHPLYYASLLGFGRVVNALVSSSPLADVNLTGGTYGSALASASARGYKDVVRVLLEHGADVNLGVGGEYGSALASASARGHKEVVEILLKKGADVNMAGGYYGSALASASNDGVRDVVQILLQNGADVNMAGGYRGSALASAAANGHKEVVQILIEKGADVNVVEKFYGSPLASASACGHKEVMHILLKNGADVNLPGGYHGSALASASAYGCKQVVQILLEMGADVNMAGGYYGGALASASAEGCKEVVQILLENKANVNMTGGQYGSALASASAKGHQDIARILLEKGADVNSLGGGNQSPLRLASVNGHLAIAQVLLDHGADVNLKQEDGRSAFRCAREESHEAIVQLLLKHGADPDDIAVGDALPVRTSPKLLNLS